MKIVIKSKRGKRVKKRASFFSADARFATKAIIVIAITTAVFIVAQYVSFLITGMEQTSLIDNYFNAVVFECGALMVKRVSEVIVGRAKKKENIDTNTTDESEGL